MKLLLFKRTTALAVSFCLTLTFLSATVLQAEELKSFLTIKIASPSAILDVAGKISDLAGQKTVYEMAVNPYKSLNGFNAKGSIGLVLRTNGDEVKEPILILPITDLTAIDIPGFEAVLAGVKKVSDGKYLLNSPIGNYALEQKKDFLLMFPEDSQEPLPEAPETLLADLDTYTIGVKADLENVSMDAINMLLAPAQMFMAMQGGEEAVKSMDALIENIERTHQEIQTMTFGLTFDPKTADLRVDGLAVPKKDSNAAKQIAAMKEAKTAFSGFHTTSDNAIFSWNFVQTGTVAEIATAMDSLDRFFEGFLAQVEEQAEEDADIELVQSLMDSIRTITEETLKKDKIDTAGSFNSDGTLLFAGTLAETEEVKKVVQKLFDYAKKKGPSDMPNFFDASYFSADYATIEGYKVSSVKYPLSLIKDEDVPQNLADKTLSLFWGLKENEAFVAAFGLEFDKTKKTFEEALAKTKSPVPVTAPQFMFAAQPLGKLLSTFSLEEFNEESKQLLDALNGAGKDAKITIYTEAHGEDLQTKVLISGRLIKALVDYVIAIGASDAALNRSGIEDF